MEKSVNPIIMKYLLPLIVVFFSYWSNGQEALQQKSIGFVNSMKNGEFESTASFFADELKAQIPGNALSGIWNNLVSQNGKFKSVVFNCSEQEDSVTITYSTCTFKNNTFDVKLAFNKNDRVIGFFVVPIHSCDTDEKKETYTPPSYDKVEAYKSEDVEIQNGQYKLPGTLLLPVESSQKVVVIFVHGSGPNDRNESIGPNKTFKDLAIGLAVNGIASLRYDKRTFANRISDVEHFTIQDEVLDDVDAVINWVSKQEELKTKNIVLLGHSLGAMLLPYSGVNNDKVRGLIMMAGPAGKLEDLLLYQYKYIFELDGKISKEERAEIEKLEKAVAMVQNNLTEATPTSELPLSLPASYWMSLNSIDQVALAEKFDGPILIMNGERDYQVPISEFEKWKDSLADYSNVTFNAFPKLNHFFLEGEGTPSSEEYSVPSHVPSSVIEEIVRWIDANI